MLVSREWEAREHLTRVRLGLQVHIRYKLFLPLFYAVICNWTWNILVARVRFLFWPWGRFSFYFIYKQVDHIGFPAEDHIGFLAELQLQRSSHLFSNKPSSIGPLFLAELQLRRSSHLWNKPSIIGSLQSLHQIFGGAKTSAGLFMELYNNNVIDTVSLAIIVSNCRASLSF